MPDDIVTIILAVICAGLAIGFYLVLGGDREDISKRGR